MPTLSGKTALVTGGGTGIGRAIAERFAAEGAKVLIAGRRPEPLAERAKAAADKISPVQMDVAKPQDRTRALAEVSEKLGGLDILVNCAAISHTGPFAEHTPDAIKAIVDVNLTAPMLLIHEALPMLIESRGSIINISSAAARYQGMPPAMVTPYAASKAGLNQLSKALATELGPLGIRVNVVAPGLTDTEIAAEAFQNQAVIDAISAITPLGRTASPEEIARVAHFLATDEAGWVTGQIVDATGGLWLSN